MSEVPQPDDEREAQGQEGGDSLASPLVGQIGQIFAIAKPGDVVFVETPPMTEKERFQASELFTDVHEQTGVTVVVLEGDVKVARIDVPIETLTP